MARPYARSGKSLIVAAALTVTLSNLCAQPVGAQQSRHARVSLSSLIAQGFEIKATTGNQVGTVGTLVLQKNQDVFLCNAKDLSIDPTTFECWPVK